MDEKKKLELGEIVTQHTLGRRSSLGVIGGIAIGAVATACGGGRAVSTGEMVVRGTACTDQDPTDPVGAGRGRGISDSDPSDPVGCGSRECSDSDPNDPAGRGRHC